LGGLTRLVAAKLEFDMFDLLGKHGDMQIVLYDEVEHSQHGPRAPMIHNIFACKAADNHGHPG